MTTPVSPVLEALYRGHRDEAGRLAADRSLDVFEASALGRDDRVAELLADPSLAQAWSPDGFTALHLAAFLGNARTVRLLLDAGADPCAVARNGMAVTPLHSAASSRKLDVTALLIAHGADLDAQQQGGFTALHAAAAHADDPMVRQLIDRGANPDLVNDQGRTAADLAEERGHPELAARIRRRQTA